MIALEGIHPAVLAAVVAVFGLLIGSFLNVVILRLPARLFHDWKNQCRELLGAEDDSQARTEVPAQGRDDSGRGELEGGPEESPPPSLVFTRSHCPQCRATIAWYDNIPLLSWLLLRARCRHCGAPISMRYPLVEALTAILFVTVIAVLGPTWQGLAALVFTAFLIAGSGIDFDHQLLPDQLTLPLLWLGLALNAIGLFTDLQSAVIGAIVGYGILWLVFHAFRLLTGKEGMGYGDFKLLAAIGAWFGWQVLPAVILIASLVGAVVGIILILARRQGRHVPIAFGPYLAAAGWIAMLWGEPLARIYAFY